MPSEDQNLDALQAQQDLAALRQDFAAFQSQMESELNSARQAASTAEQKYDALLAVVEKIQQASVTGPGHSGTIRRGLMFNPGATDAGGGSGGALPLKKVIIVDNGVRNYYMIGARLVGPV